MKTSPHMYAIVDVETTGGSPVHDRIIEIAILRVENGSIVERFTSLVNPQRPLPSSIEMITGIHPGDLYRAPYFGDISEKVSELLLGAVFIAHNVRFDYGFIKNELKREGISFQAKCLCTVRLSRKLFPDERKHDLSSVIERSRIVCKQRHRALDDAQALYDFMVHIKKGGREKEMFEAISSLLKENTLPQFLDEKSIRMLPEGPGVYFFYGENDELLYIGKSKNIRYRVLSHFSNDYASSKEMHLCQQTVRVEGRSTPGELSALLLESELIKEFSPLYNRQLRKQKELVVARLIVVNGFESVMLERLKIIDPVEFGQIVGVFRSYTQAKDFLFKTRDEYGLCGKLLGLEKSKGSCFYKGLSKCNGACSGEENTMIYNKRFKQAFKARRLKAWPFKGPILIEERKNDSEKQSFVLDNWCLVYSIMTDTSGAEVKTKDQKFDYDSYKIFLKYLKSEGNRKNVHELTHHALEAQISLGYDLEPYIT